MRVAYTVSFAGLVMIAILTQPFYFYVKRLKIHAFLERCIIDISLFNLT